MTTTRRTTCDGCQRVLLDEEREVSAQFPEGKATEFLMTSIDPHYPEKESYRFRGVSWDLCVPCARTVYEAVCAVGGPRHDSLGEVLT